MSTIKLASPSVKTSRVDEKTAVRALAKKVYYQPTLTNYGTVTDLTAAGSAGAPEGSSSSINKAAPNLP